MSNYTNASGWYVRIPDGRYMTIAPIMWEIGKKHSDYIVTVPVDTPFDVSVPWFARWLFDPHDEKYLKAACLHDHLLHDRGWERITAGSIFHNALRADGVSAWRRLVMWIAVSVRKYR